MRNAGVTDSARRRGRSGWALTALATALGLLLTAVGGSVLPAPARATAWQLAAAPQLPSVLDGAVLAYAVRDGVVYVGGSFHTLRLPDGTSLAQPALFAYRLDTGALVPGFRPRLDGQVDALAAPAGGGVLAGGTFTRVDGLPRARLARLAADGSAVPAFSPAPDQRVDALALSGDRLFVGGAFTRVAGAARNHLAEVDARTGALAAGFDVPVTGSTAPGGYVTVHSLDVSPDGSRLLLAHDGVRVAGQLRYGVAVVDLTAGGAHLDPWVTRLWQDRLPRLGGLVRVTDAAFGPDGRWFVVTSTGGDLPPTNDCVQRFDLAAPLPADPTWVTRQFDSAYAVAVGGDGTVYTGGHFHYTEAPGAPDPFPGDPLVNYGFGPSGGAAVLGDQVLGRQQLDALDPATGWARDWWTTADGHHGVTALAVAGDRLLVGHDGSQVGGRVTGRIGVLSTVDAPPAAGAATSRLASPPAGAVLAPGAVQLAGPATAAAGLGKVQVSVRSQATGGYLHADGSWGAWAALTAQTSGVGTAAGSWQLGVDLPTVGSWLVQPRAFDTAGRAEPAPSPALLQTVTPALSGPKVTVLSPAKDQVLTGSPTITLSGTATDPQGVAAVGVSLYDVTAGAWLAAPGRLGEHASFPATMAAPGATSTAWSLTTTLPDGRWTAFVGARDGAGTALPQGVSRPFVMAVGNPAPTLAISSPAPGAETGGGDLVLSGSASDDSGVRRVRVLVADPRFGLGPTGTGRPTPLGPAGWLDAEVADPGARHTSWTVRLPGLPPGDYQVQALAVDDLGVATDAAARPRLTVHAWPAGDHAAPDTVLTAPTWASRPQQPVLDAAGTATAPGGVAQVLVYVREHAGRGWLRADGSLSALPVGVPAVLDRPGAGATGWTVHRALPGPGTYDVHAVAVQPDGLVDPGPAGSWVSLPVYPGDADPTATLVSPADGARMAAGALAAGGRAFDDVGVEQVLVLVRTADGRTGVQADGTVGPVPAWRQAFVTNPGGPSTNWNLTSPALPAGRWTVSARARDSVGKLTVSYPSAKITLTP